MLPLKCTSMALSDCTWGTLMLCWSVTNVYKLVPFIIIIIIFAIKHKIVLHVSVFFSSKVLIKVPVGKNRHSTCPEKYTSEWQ